MKWIPLRDGIDNFVNADDVLRLECRPRPDGEYDSVLHMRDGAKYIAGIDVNEITAPTETSVPAEAGYDIVRAVRNADGSFSFKLHPVVAWRIIDGIALPAATGFTFEYEEHTALVGPDCMLRALPTTTKSYGWGTDPKPMTFREWVKVVTRHSGLELEHL